MNNRIIPIVTIILSVLLFYFYIDPTYMVDIANLSKQIADDSSIHTAAQDYKTHATALASFCGSDADSP